VFPAKMAGVIAMSFTQIVRGGQFFIQAFNRIVQKTVIYLPPCT